MSAQGSINSARRRRAEEEGRMSKQWKIITVFAFVMTVGGAILAGAQSSQATSVTPAGGLRLQEQGPAE